ncbi:RHTO0S04e05666g1_1 [Rhodotorula toruloides]|uniref:RHTO0S04e05666g1_1 n=1 Tax=Rhodotorula toruloides TaxID=5286 RepID=A0A061AXR4_RHOTO|nr:RHTO0S04e05666g1_1 [Rhodotorula toruloides]
MPKDNYGQSYDISSSGTNDQGNHYCSRYYSSDASNSNSYHYSNSDGSYYYSNSDGSTYYNSGDGYSNYTSPSGQSYQSSGNQK